MSVERGVLLFAGILILLSVVLTYFVHIGFLWLTVFIGANMIQSAFTGFCPSAWVMHRLLHMHTEREQALGAH